MDRQKLQWKAATAIAGIFLNMSAASDLYAGYLTVSVNGIPSDSGYARFVLADSISGYEGKSDPIRIASVRIENGMATWDAGPFPAGRYAVIAYHDTNANGQLDRLFFGLPFEPYGFTRGAWKTFGIPGWSETSFPVSAQPKTEHISLRMNPVAAAIHALWAGFPALALVCAGLGLVTMTRRHRLRRNTKRLSNTEGDLS